MNRRMPNGTSGGVGGRGRRRPLLPDFKGMLAIIAVTLRQAQDDAIVLAGCVWFVAGLGRSRFDFAQRDIRGVRGTHDDDER
jgi:hypothetical protein